MIKTLFLVRHAKPQFPTEERYCLGGRTDWPIGEEGRKQCGEMADKLLPVLSRMQQEGLKTEIWSSPLIRAMQTARYLCKEGEKPKTKEGFREMDAGLWDGLPFSRIREEFPEAYAARKNRQGMSLIPGAESDEDGLARFEKALEEMLSESDADVIVLVAHATVIQLFRCALAGKPLQESMDYKPQYAEVVQLDAEMLLQRPDVILNRQIRELARQVREAEHIVFFGGAGVSTESGVPDFRSKDGLYNQHDIRFDRYRPEYLLSHTCLTREPEVFYEFYRQKMNAAGVKPNAAHKFLADLEASGKDIAVVTQNIDGLHQKAGSRRVYEIHGSTERNYCMRCGKQYPADHIYASKEKIPRCSCGGMVRCDVTLYEEALPEEAVRGAVDAIRNADLMIIGGTSLSVYPAASYIDFFQGRFLTVINRDRLDLCGRKISLQINASIGKVLEAAGKYL